MYQDTHVIIVTGFSWSREPLISSHDDCCKLFDCFPRSEAQWQYPCGLAQASNTGKQANSNSPKGCGDNGAGGRVGFVLTARMGMRAQHEP